MRSLGDTVCDAFCETTHDAVTRYQCVADVSECAIGRQPSPLDAGDEEGPDSVVTKQQHITYLKGSFDAVEKAIDAIRARRIPVRSSPISPFQGATATRLSLIAESLIHSYDHYGQMVEYLRMNGIVPPASKG
jgi:hypothetical protein